MIPWIDSDRRILRRLAAYDCPDAAVSLFAARGAACVAERPGATHITNDDETTRADRHGIARKDFAQ